MTTGSKTLNYKKQYKTIHGKRMAYVDEGKGDLVRSWPNVTEVTVPGLHFIQEDSPDHIGEAIASWLDHSERK